MEMEYYHSVTLDKSRCRGCTTCLKRCPTEAIRIRDNRAAIINERCIDCGECIKVCSYHAKVAKTDALESIHSFKYKIALPAPTLYTQFKNVREHKAIIAGLLELGFDDVFEVARAAELITYAVKERIKSSKGPRPLISSACPAIVRLIRVKYPALIDNIIDVLSPMDAAAVLAKEGFCKKNKVNAEEVGAFFITPCAAKITAIKSPLGMDRSSVDGAISIVDVYGMLVGRLNEAFDKSLNERAGAIGVGWAASGGEISALGVENSLSVDGISNVMHVLEEIENGKLNDLEYFEGLACTGGCLGGPLVFENRYVAQNRIRKIVEKLPKRVQETGSLMENKNRFLMTEPILPNKSMQLEGTIPERLEKMERIDSIYATLPGIDCGSCGSPTCRTLAEDIVRGYATELNCIFKLKDKIQFLAEQMLELSDSTRFFSGIEREK